MVGDRQDVGREGGLSRYLVSRTSERMRAKIREPRATCPRYKNSIALRTILRWVPGLVSLRCLARRHENAGGSE